MFQLLSIPTSNGLRLELFVIKDDSEGGEFYYLGPLKYIDGSASEIVKSGDSLFKCALNWNIQLKQICLNI